MGKVKSFQAAVIIWLLLSILLAACSDEPKPAGYIPPAGTSSNVGNTDGGATATPPFPGLRDSSPTPTADRNLPLLPTATAPALFPSPTVARPTQSNVAIPTTPADTKLTPTAFPTGQLAYLQAGNLWLIDDTAGSRRQITTGSEIAPDAPLAWSPARDKVVYVAKSGELVLVDLQGKRTVVFTPGKSATLAPPNRLETTNPTPIPSGKPATPAAGRPTLQVDELVWSVDGRYLAFSYFSNESGRLASAEVWLADLITDKVGLTKAGTGFAPNWSADGRTLAFVSRAEIKQNGAPRPTPTVTSTPFPDNGVPRGTPLLPPTRSGQGQALEGFMAQSIVTPTPSAPAVTSAASSSSPAPGAPTPTFTPFLIIGPGGAATPTPFGQPSINLTGTIIATIRANNTPFPTPTLKLSALPSPSPTPTYPPVFVGTYAANKIVLYNPATKSSRPVFESDKLPDAFTDINGALRSYVPAPLQAVWWSPDSRFLAFSDKKSVVGVITVATGTPVIWTGNPEQYAVYNFDWLPRSDGAFFRYFTPNDSQGFQLALATFNNPNATGVNGDVTNQKMLKLTPLPGTAVSCPELSPGANFYSYYDGRVIVIVRTDGTLFSTFTDSDCPAWSPFGRIFATIRRDGDGTIGLTDLDRPVNVRNLLSARAVERVFWLRADPTNLGGPPTPAPTSRP